MKSCPICHRTYSDDTLAFCLMDGSVLSGARPSEQTLRISPGRDTNPPATEILPEASSAGKSLPHFQSTIRAPLPPVPALHQGQFVAEGSPIGKRRAWPWLVVAVGVLVLAIFGVRIVFALFAAKNSSSPQVSAPRRSSSTVSNSLTAEDGVDRPGSDYRNFDLPETNFEICREACANDAKCVAYTFVRPGIQGLRAKCWLKSAVPSAGPSSCCISGVKTTSK